MTAPTDHLAAARVALASAGLTSSSVVIDRYLTYAVANALIALAEEARTANLIAALDYNITSRDDVVKRLWPTS